MDSEDIKSVVTWALIVSGWLIVNIQNNKREARKEARALTDAVRALCISICTEGVKYWSNAESDSFEIKSNLEILNGQLERFPNAKYGGYLMTAFGNFWEAITDGDFESKARTAEGPESQRLNRMLATRNALLVEAEKAFKLHYC